jgi:hypothetical protein
MLQISSLGRQHDNLPIVIMAFYPQKFFISNKAVQASDP